MFFLASPLSITPRGVARPTKRSLHPFEHHFLAYITLASERSYIILQYYIYVSRRRNHLHLWIFVHDGRYYRINWRKEFLFGWHSMSVLCGTRPPGHGWWWNNGYIQHEHSSLRHIEQNIVTISRPNIGLKMIYRTSRSTYFRLKVLLIEVMCSWEPNYSLKIGASSLQMQNGSSIFQFGFLFAWNIKWTKHLLHLQVFHIFLACILNL